LALTTAWCALWGSLHPGAILSGLVLSIAIEMLEVGPPGVGRIRLVPLLKLVAIVSWDLVISTVGVAKEVLTPGDTTDEGIIAVDLGAAARDHFLLITIAVTVTPGTAVVDVDPDTGTVYLHLLFMDEAEETVAALRDLVRLAELALPVGSPQQAVGASS